MHMEGEIPSANVLWSISAFRSSPMLIDGGFTDLDFFDIEVEWLGSVSLSSMNTWLPFECIPDHQTTRAKHRSHMYESADTLEPRS